MVTDPLILFYSDIPFFPAAPFTRQPEAGRRKKERDGLRPVLWGIDRRKSFSTASPSRSYNR